MAKLPEPLHSTIRAIDEAVLRDADDGFRAHLGASILGRACERALWYSFRWCTPADFPARILRLFARGQREEDVIAELLRAAGVEVYSHDPECGEQFRFTAHGGHLGGSMDGCGVGFAEAPETWHVIEYKTHNDKSFKDLQRHGVEKSKPEHYGQMMIYMHLSGMERAAYLAVNKNDDDLYLERVRYSATKAQVLMDKAKRIIASDRPPERISQDPAWYQCKWCDHQNVCHQAKVPPPTCRSCIHATPELDGDGRWSCAHQGIDLDTEAQIDGCGFHTYIPDLLPWATVEDAGDSGIQYTNTINGRKFWNAPHGYPSIELYQGEPGIVGHEVVDQLRDEFDAKLTGTLIA